MEMEAMIDSSASNYIIPSLQLDNGWFIFSPVSKFLSSITPNDMPLIYCILELLRDAFQSKVSLLQIILEALKVESGYICFIIVIFLISITPFCYTIAWCFSRNVKLKARNGVRDIVQASTRAILPTGILMHDECKEKLNRYHCRKRVFVLVLQFMVVLTILIVLFMFIINEQISSSINQTPNVMRSSLKDSEFFIKSSNHQLQSEIFEQFDRTREKIKIDLEDIDKLLGERVTREISIQTGIDLTLESTNEILGSTRNLSQKVQHLMNDILVRSLMLAAEASAKVDEIHYQLTELQRLCNYRERPLCDTLKVKTFEEMGFIDRLKNLNGNPFLQKLRIMNDDYHDNILKKLTEELSLSKKLFRNYSYQLQLDSERQKDEIIRQMTFMRNGLNESFNKLSSLVKHVVDKLGKVWGRISPILDNFNEAGYYNWLIGLASCASTLVVTLFLLVPISCTCCNDDRFVGAAFILAASIFSVFGVFLGLFVIFEMLLGGHAEVFVCRAMFEQPEYAVIGKLFDNPGIMFSNPPYNGALSELLVTSEQSSVLFTNISLTTALEMCENNNSTFSTFQLENLLDLKNLINYEIYPNLIKSINVVKASDLPFIKFTQKIQFILTELLETSYYNFTHSRMEVTQVSPDKEMNHFIDQLQRVSIQIQDRATASRMASLTTSARRIQSTILNPLETLKNEIFFQLTALELHIDPWMHRVTEIKENFNLTQKFLDDNVTDICLNYSEAFRSRLVSNLENFRSDTWENLHMNFGCRPLFDTFNGIRWLTCGHIVEPISGLFILSLIVLFIWTLSTPVSLSLASTYEKIENVQHQLNHTTTHHSFESSSPTDGVTNRDIPWSSVRPRTPVPSSPEIDRSNWLSVERDTGAFVEMELDDPENLN